jgi:putative membrane protein
VEGVQTLKNGSRELADGAGTLYDGTVTLKDGTAELLDGAGQLYDGTTTLKDGTGELLDGAEQLLDGAKELRDGMKEFDEEGIQKLSDLLNADIGGVVDRFKALRDYANEYTSFSGSAEDTDTGVKFVIRTDSIGE